MFAANFIMGKNSVIYRFCRFAGPPLTLCPALPPSRLFQTGSESAHQYLDSLLDLWICGSVELCVHVWRCLGFEVGVFQKVVRISR